MVRLLLIQQWKREDLCLMDLDHLDDQDLLYARNESTCVGEGQDVDVDDGLYHALVGRDDDERKTARAP